MATHSQIIEHVHKSLNYTVYDTKWVPSSARVAVLGAYARGTGAIEVMEMEKGKLEVRKRIEAEHPVKCSTFGASSLAERHIATGDFEGGVAVWDLEAGKSIHRFSAHSKIVNAIDGCGGLGVGGGAPELVTGSRDGAVKVWDTRVKDPVASLVPPSEDAARDCWTVAFGNSFNDEERVVAAGYDNGDIKLFDLRTNAMLWETNVSNGVCSVEFDRKDIEMNKLVATALESNFAVYDLRTKHKDLGYSHLTEKAHKSTVWLCRHLPQNREIFMTCGGNGSLNLYKYKYPGQRKILDKDTGLEKGVMGSLEMLASAPLSTQPIASFDWHRDKEGLCVMGSFDQTVRIAIATKLNTA